MVTCSSCQAQNDPSHNFCDTCGAPLQVVASPVPSAQPVSPQQSASTIRCAQCGHAIVPGEMFCDDCGAPLGSTLSGATAAPPAPLPPQPFAPAFPPLMPVSPSRTTLHNAMLIIQSSGSQIALPDKNEVLIGREDSLSSHFPDVDLTPHNGEACGVSRNHARLHVQQGQVLLEDLNTTNHTRVNKQLLQPKQLQPLNDGDEVRFGNLVTTFRMN